MTLIHDLLDLPEAVRKGDCVQDLSGGIGNPDRTVRDYATTPKILQTFEVTEEVLTALATWKPEVEEDDDDDAEETEPPEGPTDVELASAVGVTKAVMAKALEKLVSDGLVEKLSGRPARYVATAGAE